MDEETKRGERAILKGKLATSIRKLKGSISRGGELDELKVLASQVESAYDALSECHFQLQDGDETYLDIVDSEYQTAMESFCNKKKAFAEIELRKKITASRKSIKSMMKKVSANVNKLSELLTSETDTHMLEVEKEFLEKSLKTINQNVSELMLLEADDELEESLFQLEYDAEMVIKSVCVYVRRSSDALRPTKVSSQLTPKDSVQTEAWSEEVKSGSQVSHPVVSDPPSDDQSTKDQCGVKSHLVSQKSESDEHTLSTPLASMGIGTASELPHPYFSVVQPPSGQLSSLSYGQLCQLPSALSAPHSTVSFEASLLSQPPLRPPSFRNWDPGIILLEL